MGDEFAAHDPSSTLSDTPAIPAVIHQKQNPEKKTPSRQSTMVSKTGAEAHGSRTTTPLSFYGSSGNRGIKHDLNIDDYFVGPRDMDAHSKLPYFMRLHGSVIPRMVVPLWWIACWSTLITCVSKFSGTELAVNTLLLTVLGFVISLALSFKSTTAYERYSEGRKAWAALSVQSRNIARFIWVNIKEREGDVGKEDLIAKVTGINLILTFAVALKHKLRFEPYAHYADIVALTHHLNTYAQSATTPEVLVEKKRTPWKRVGEYLGLSFATSNPRKAIKRSSKPVGNLPNEILTYLSAYIEGALANGTLDSAVVFGQIISCISALTECSAAAERVLQTPLPIGYNILISQIVYLYVYLLPFQLFAALGWVTIPGTIAAAYIIVGLMAIGNELENPFGNDVNDLPLDNYCAELARDLDILTSVKAPTWEEIVYGRVERTHADTEGELMRENKVFWPLSNSGVRMWINRDEKDLRDALAQKVVVAERQSRDTYTRAEERKDAVSTVRAKTGKSDFSGSADSTDSAA
ncbi:hypothetical protein DSL72_002072 [Monilinia vaccinii-corymbosi]|uniref:Uncharacterized protein n=1 Tax=Monilinia vaccinii-corymbosi TaxID=61207 RepID=A0A8A3PBK5_9HELO|nr:hypothetical protein DSL72_002072 [Monilinia vaccinii-corymbosi]